MTFQQKTPFLSKSLNLDIGKMISDYLQNPEDFLFFADKEEFDSKVAALDLSVPARDAGRKSFHRERFAIIMYLKDKVNESQVHFPLKVDKSESPDFVITMGESSGLVLNIQISLLKNINTISAPSEVDG